MTIKELKNFIESLPVEFENYDITIRSFTKEGENTYMLDTPIVSAYVDEDNNEFCLLDQENNQKLQKLRTDNEETDTGNGN